MLVGAAGRTQTTIVSSSRLAIPFTKERGFAAIMGERAPQSATPSPARAGPADVRPTHAAPTPPGVEGSQLRQLLTGLLERERRVDALVQASMSGRTFTVQELIGMQAMVFRYTQELEVASRLIDRAAGAIKTTLQTQV
jgi:hypothetical protein